MKILVSALETSSNIHFEYLKKELENNNIEFCGIFDKRLGNPNYDITELAIMGFSDALKRLPFFLKLKNKMVELANDCDKILLMDSSGFNLPLAKSLKKKYPNKEIIYYILPQAWAWKRKRVFRIERDCDKLCSIIPFERDIYPNPSRVNYVGHPLLDEIKNFKDEVINTKKIVFMPGSRRGEITKLLPIYKQVAKSMEGYEKILVIPKNFSEEKIKEFYGDISEFNISKDAHKSLYEAEFAFICSGTATLEATLIGTPFCLTYIAKSLDYFIGKRVIKIPYIGLANIFFEKLGKEPLHKEFLQEEVNKNNLLKEFQELNKDEFFQNSLFLRNYLKEGSSKNVAQIILE